MIPPYFFTETTETETFQINWNNWSKLIGMQPLYNPQNEMLPFHKTKCSETQNEASSL